MADRKQFFGVKDADPELLALLTKSRDRVVTEAELQEQSISFAYGNALEAPGITKESVRKAASSLDLERSDSDVAERCTLYVHPAKR